MQAKWKWLLLPPALALVLFLGPLRDVAAPKSVHSTAAPAASAANPGTNDANPSAAATARGPAEFPGLWQVGSTLLGVLLLGGVGLAVLARCKGRGLGGAAGPVSVRQSLRLSPRHRLHAVVLEGRLLLVGECEGNLAVLHTGTDPEVLADEARVAGRDDDGAVPRDMILPAVPPRRLPPRPRQPLPDPAAAAAGQPATGRNTLADFQALLRKLRPERVAQ